MAPILAYNFGTMIIGSSQDVIGPPGSTHTDWPGRDGGKRRSCSGALIKLLALKPRLQRNCAQRSANRPPAPGEEAMVRCRRPRSANPCCAKAFTEKTPITARWRMLIAPIFVTPNDSSCGEHYDDLAGGVGGAVHPFFRTILIGASVIAAEYLLPLVAARNVAGHFVSNVLAIESAAEGFKERRSRISEQESFEEMRAMRKPVPARSATAAGSAAHSP